MANQPAITPVLYTKQGCPYCDEVLSFFNEHGLSYRQKDVTTDAAASEEMKRLSGQTKAPTLDWNGKILADFDVKELVPFLQKQNVEFEDS